MQPFDILQRILLRQSLWSNGHKKLFDDKQSCFSSSTLLVGVTAEALEKPSSGYQEAVFA